MVIIELWHLFWGWHMPVWGGGVSLIMGGVFIYRGLYAYGILSVPDALPEDNLFTSENMPAEGMRESMQTLGQYDERFADTFNGHVSPAITMALLNLIGPFVGTALALKGGLVVLNYLIK